MFLHCLSPRHNLLIVLLAFLFSTLTSFPDNFYRVQMSSSTTTSSKKFLLLEEAIKNVQLDLLAEKKRLEAEAEQLRKQKKELDAKQSQEAPANDIYIIARLGDECDTTFYEVKDDGGVIKEIMKWLYESDQLTPDFDPKKMQVHVALHEALNDLSLNTSQSQRASKATVFTQNGLTDPLDSEYNISVKQWDGTRNGFVSSSLAIISASNPSFNQNTYG